MWLPKMPQSLMQGRLLVGLSDLTHTFAAANVV